MPSAEIVTVGTELLLGQLVDTNTAHIAAALADAGVDVFRETSIGDNESRIASVVGEAMGRADIVVCAGGLGPTVDDLTRAAVARATGRPLERRPDLVEEVRSFFTRLGRTMPDNNLAQAEVPLGAHVMHNPNGTAPGFIVEVDGKAVLALPGPPRELQPMLKRDAIPWLRERFGLDAVIVTRVLHTAGVGESTIDDRIRDLFAAGVNPSIAVLSRPGEVDVKITAKARTRDEALALIATLEREVRGRVGDAIFGADDETLEGVLGAALRARSWSIAVAESCTGGLLSEMLTSAPGSSDYFRGGAIAYADEAKTALLGVERSLIDRHGAVSGEVAEAMARGARAAFGADLALSTTGVAGPGGGTPEKPVGLVFVGVAAPDGGSRHIRAQLPGNRALVRKQASLVALLAALRLAR